MANLAYCGAGLLAAHAASADNMKLLHSERSLYREVLVYETGDVRCICFTRYCRIGRQTCQDVKHPDRIVMNYPQMMVASAVPSKPEPKSVLIIGLGGGTIPARIDMSWCRRRASMWSRSIRRSSKWRERYFDLGDNSELNVIEADGRGR